MRYITLLEFQPGLVVTDVMPPHSYLEKTNGTLPQENCTLRIDENGFMVSQKPCGEKDSRILLLGNSVIENLYIPEDQRIMSCIEDVSNERGYNTKVYNAAVSDMHLLHAINVLLNKGIALRPSHVVLYMMHGLDIVANELENSFWNTDGAMTPIRKSGQDIKKEPCATYSNKNKFEDEKRLLRLLSDICKNFNIHLIIANSPLYGEHDEFLKNLPPHLMNFDVFDQQQVLIADLNEVVRDICREYGHELVDLEHLFADLAHRRYFYDVSHPNKDGCKLIASVTALALQSCL